MATDKFKRLIVPGSYVLYPALNNSTLRLKIGRVMHIQSNGAIRVRSLEVGDIAQGTVPDGYRLFILEESAVPEEYRKRGVANLRDLL